MTYNGGSSGSSNSNNSSGSDNSSKGKGHLLKRHKNQNNKSIKQSSFVFEGECAELKDNVYTFGDAKQADRYHKTTEVIVNHIQKHFDHGQDTKDSLISGVRKDLTQYEPSEPKTVIIDKVIQPLSKVQGFLIPESQETCRQRGPIGYQLQQSLCTHPRPMHSRH